MSGVALVHGLTAKLVFTWRSGRGAKRAGMVITPPAAIHAPPAPLHAAPEFVAVEMPAPAKPAARAQVRPPVLHGLIMATTSRTRGPHTSSRSSTMGSFVVCRAARRLNGGHFAWPREATRTRLSLTQSQFDDLILDLPWKRLLEMSVITRM
jgi:hypothetical protein